MQLNLRITYFIFILATVVASLLITGCDEQQNKKDHAAARTKELAGKYNEGKDVFQIHCSS